MEILSYKSSCYILELSTVCVLHVLTFIWNLWRTSGPIAKPKMTVDDFCAAFFFFLSFGWTTCDLCISFQFM